MQAIALEVGLDGVPFLHAHCFQQPGQGQGVVIRIGNERLDTGMRRQAGMDLQGITHQQSNVLRVFKAQRHDLVEFLTTH